VTAKAMTTTTANVKKKTKKAKQAKAQAKGEATELAKPWRSTTCEWKKKMLNK